MPLLRRSQEEVSSAKGTKDAPHSSAHRLRPSLKCLDAQIIFGHAERRDYDDVFGHCNLFVRKKQAISVHLLPNACLQRQGSCIPYNAGLLWKHDVRFRYLCSDLVPLNHLWLLAYYSSAILTGKDKLK